LAEVDTVSVWIGRMVRMATAHPLLDVAGVDSLEPYLAEVGEVFAAFREQGSGCVSYGVRLL